MARHRSVQQSARHSGTQPLLGVVFISWKSTAGGFRCEAEAAIKAVNVAEAVTADAVDSCLAAKRTSSRRLIKELSLDKPGAQPLKVSDSIYQEAHFKKSVTRQVNSDKCMEGIPRYVETIVDTHRGGNAHREDALRGGGRCG